MLISPEDPEESKALFNTKMTDLMIVLGGFWPYCLYLEYIGTCKSNIQVNQSCLRNVISLSELNQIAIKFPYKWCIYPQISIDPSINHCNGFCLGAKFDPT